MIRSLVKSSGIYAIASVASPLLSLLLSPFLTHTLAATEYGALAILNTMIALAAGITQLGLNSAFFRAYNYDYETREDRSAIFSTVVILLLASSLPVTFGVMIAAPALSTLLFNTPTFADAIRFAVLSMVLQNLTIPGFAWLRAENRALLFSLLSVANLLVTLSMTLILIGGYHQGIVGSLAAVGCGYGVVAGIALPFILLRAGLRFRLDIARNLLSFGVPLVFHFIFYWVLQLSDRYLLGRYSLAQAANYAIAYSLGSIVGVVILSPFILAWPTTMFAIAKKEQAAQLFKQVFRWFSMILLFAAFAFSIIGNILLTLLFPPPYHVAAPVIPVVAASQVFYGIYNIFAVGVGVTRKTWLTALFTGLAASANIGCNLVLIPLYGSMGAAISTLVAYVLLALITYVVNQRIYPVPFEIWRFLLALLLGVVLFVDSYFLQQAIYLFYALPLLALVLYGGGLILIGDIPVAYFRTLPRWIKEQSFS